MKIINIREHMGMFISEHAKKQAESRSIPRSTFWAAEREARRTGLKEKMILQHQKLSRMLTDIKIPLKIGESLYRASKTEITTRLIVGGVTFAVGIRKCRDDYSPLTCLTDWR